MRKWIAALVLGALCGSGCGGNDEHAETGDPVERTAEEICDEAIECKMRECGAEIDALAGCQASGACGGADGMDRYTELYEDMWGCFDQCVPGDAAGSLRSGIAAQHCHVASASAECYEARTACYEG